MNKKPEKTVGSELVQRLERFAKKLETVDRADDLGSAPSNLANLVDEYAALVSDSQNPNWELIEAKLIDVHDWTPDAAHALVSMAKQYGWFFLRNATALAIACDQEDGDLGI